MIKVYILRSTVEEIKDKPICNITDEEFKLFGYEYDLKDLEHFINNYSIQDELNLSTDYIRFIDDKKNNVASFLRTEVGNGFLIKFFENQLLEEGVGILHLNPKNMPKHE